MLVNKISDNMNANDSAKINTHDNRDISTTIIIILD